MKIIFILFLVIFISYGCSHEPEIGSINHLNLHENDYRKIYAFMSKNKIYNFDIQRDTGYDSLKRLMIQAEVTNAYMPIFNKDTSSVSSIYYDVGLQRSYIYDFSKQDSTKEYKYLREKLVRLKERWYYWERSRFGYVE